MKIRSILAGVLAGLAMAWGAWAAVPAYDVYVDFQQSERPFEIKGIFTGNTPTLRFHMLEDGVAFSNLTSGYTAIFRYGANRDTASMVSLTGTIYASSSYIDFIGRTNTFPRAGENYLAELILTGTNLLTWGQGTMRVIKSPGAGSVGGLDLRTIINWDLITSIGTTPWAAGTEPLFVGWLGTNTMAESNTVWSYFLPLTYTNWATNAFLPLASTNVYATTNWVTNVFLPLASTNAYGSTQFNMATFLTLAVTNAYATTNWATNTFLPLTTTNTFATTNWATNTFLPKSATNAYASTNWVTNAFLPLASTNAYATTNWVTNTFLPLTETNAYAATNWAATNFYNINNPSNFVNATITNGLAGTNWVTNAFYPIGNPSNYIPNTVTNWVMNEFYPRSNPSNYLDGAATNWATNTFYPLNNPAGYVTSAVLTGAVFKIIPSTYIDVSPSNGMGNVAVSVNTSIVSKVELAYDHATTYDQVTNLVNGSNTLAVMTATGAQVHVWGLLATNDFASYTNTATNLIARFAEHPMTTNLNANNFGMTNISTNSLIFKDGTVLNPAWMAGQTNWATNVFMQFAETNWMTSTFATAVSAGADTNWVTNTFLQLPSTNAYVSTNDPKHVASITNVQAGANIVVTTNGPGDITVASAGVGAETQTVSGSTHVGVITNAADFQIVSLDSNIVDFAITNAYSLGSSGTVGQVSRVDAHNIGILFPTSTPAIDWWNYPAQGDPSLQQYGLRDIGELSFTPYSTGGMAWATSTTNAGWGGRYSLGMIVFSNEMYVLGGYLSGPTNDVLRSQNGTNWNRIVQNADWTPRYNFGVAVISNSIVLAGGRTSQHTNDVWASYDYGTNWTMIATNPGWSRRFTFSMEALNGRLVLMGGYSISTPTNDVWVSDDAGVTWSKINNAPWSRRYAFRTTIHAGKLWLMGGVDAAGTHLKDVYYTADLTNWVTATTSAAWNTRSYFGAASVGDLMYVFGGFTGSIAYATIAQDIWSSADGASWLQETVTLPVKIAEFGHCAFSNYIYTFGGEKTNVTISPAVFYGSTSSVTYAKFHVHATTNIVLTNAATFHVHADRTHIMGGFTLMEGAASNLVWTSTNDAGDGAWLAPETNAAAAAEAHAASNTVYIMSNVTAIASGVTSNAAVSALADLHTQTNADISSKLDSLQLAANSNVYVAGANMTFTTNGGITVVVASTASGGGAAQSPWTNTVDAAGNALTNFTQLFFSPGDYISDAAGQMTFNAGELLFYPGNVAALTLAMEIQTNVVDVFKSLDLNGNTISNSVITNSVVYGVVTNIRGGASVTTSTNAPGDITINSTGGGANQSPVTNTINYAGYGATNLSVLQATNLIVVGGSPTNGAVLIATNTSGQATWGSVPPVGSIVMYAASNAPSGWLSCDGSSISTSSYPVLYSTIGSTYGSTNAAWFNVPNLVGRFPLGSTNLLGVTSGVSSVTLTTDQIPAHSHTLSIFTDDAGTVTNRPIGNGFDPLSSATTAVSGGGLAHTNMPPNLTLNYIIKF